MELEFDHEMINPRPIERRQALGTTLRRAADGDAQGIGIGIGEGDRMAEPRQLGLKIRVIFSHIDEGKSAQLGMRCHLSPAARNLGTHRSRAASSLGRNGTMYWP
jgi:hypothetical protein